MTTLITNATILPCTPDMPVIEGGHLVIDDGCISAVGVGETPALQDADVFDAGGDIVMPGMVNPHCHIPMTLFRGLGEDVDDRLFRYVLPMERKFVSPEMVRVGTALGAWESIASGVTTIADMYYFEAEVGRVLDAAGLRGVVGQTLADFEPPDHTSIDEGFALVDALADEFAGHERIRPSIAPHAPYSTDIPVMKRVADWAAVHPEVLVQIHLAEMATEMEWSQKNHGCRPVEVVDRAGLLIDGLVAAHCLYLEEAEITRLSETGVRVAHNARSNAKAGRGIAPVEALRLAGVPVGIATDGPMSGNTLDLFSQFGPVSMLAKLRGNSRKPMPAADVIAMATREGARVLSMEKEIGTLEVGKAADLIRISTAAPRMQPIYDIYATLVFAAMPDDVQDVMVAGKWLMRDRKVLNLERSKVLRDAGQIAARFRAEMVAIDRERDMGR